MPILSNRPVHGNEAYSSALIVFRKIAIRRVEVGLEYSQWVPGFAVIFWDAA